jgi:hypothetical protein
LALVLEFGDFTLIRRVGTGPRRAPRGPRVLGVLRTATEGRDDVAFKNVFALGLFLFGTTFLWMTASMAGKTPPPTGTAWTLANVLCYVAVIGFAVAAWAVFKEYSWWETLAVLSGIVGLIAVVPFVVGQSQLDVGFGDLGVQINLWMHIGGSAAVIAIVLVPAAHDWIARRL